MIFIVVNSSTLIMFTIFHKVFIHFDFLCLLLLLSFEQLIHQRLLLQRLVKHDTTCTTSTARGVRVGSGTTIGRPPPRWKGYVVLTPEEVENQSRIEQAKHLEDELTSSKRTRRHHIQLILLQQHLSEFSGEVCDVGKNSRIIAE